MKKIIVANWKANLLPKESLVLAKKYSVLKPVNSNIVVCPDFLSIYSVSQLFKKTVINLGAQDSSSFSRGAHTGETSASALKLAGVQYIIIGHSEKRASGDSDKIVAEKVQKVLAEKITPIICVGENASERRSNKTKTVLKKQLLAVFNGLSKEQLSRNVVIAYEPIWAIGSGKSLDSQEANNLCDFIKKTLEEAGAKKIKVLYGGSVNVKNSSSYLKEKQIDGLLAGAISLNSRDFGKIINC